MQQSAAAWAIASLFGNTAPRPRPKRLRKTASLLLPAGQKYLAREEARSLFQLVGKNGETVGTVRDLIGIDGRLERRLLAFIEWNRLDAPWVTGAMRYRALVLEEFSRLAKSAGLVAAPEAEAVRRARLEVTVQPVPRAIAVTNAE